MYTVYSEQSRARSLTRATDAGASDVMRNSSWDCSLLSPSTMACVSLLSTLSFSAAAFVSLDSVDPILLDMGLHCMSICSSRTFPGLWGASAWEVGVFRVYLAPLAEVNNLYTLPNSKVKSNCRFIQVLMIACSSVLSTRWVMRKIPRKSCFV